MNETRIFGTDIYEMISKNCLKLGLGNEFAFYRRKFQCKAQKWKLMVLFPIAYIGIDNSRRRWAHIIFLFSWRCDGDTLNFPIIPTNATTNHSTKIMYTKNDVSTTIGTATTTSKKWNIPFVCTLHDFVTQLLNCIRIINWITNKYSTQSIEIQLNQLMHNSEIRWKNLFPNKKCYESQNLVENKIIYIYCIYL